MASLTSRDDVANSRVAAVEAANRIEDGDLAAPDVVGDVPDESLESWLDLWHAPRWGHTPRLRRDSGRRGRHDRSQTWLAESRHAP